MAARKPSVVFFGSKPASVAALAILLERQWDIRCVVPSPQNHCYAPAGPTLEVFCKQKGLPVILSDDRREFPPADFIISYLFKSRITRLELALAKRAALNFHPGSLPEFAGWSAYSLPILEDAREYGCTCHYMLDEFDSGPILGECRFLIDASQETALSLERKTQIEMIKLFKDFCAAAETGENLPSKEQERSKRRYLSQNEFEALKEIPAAADAQMVDRFARAFWYPPYGGAFICSGKLKLEVIPQIAKNEVAALVHQDALKVFLEVVKNHPPRSIHPK